MNNYTIQKLNPVQQEAVRCTEGPVLVLAGAGSGKTRVLTHRIAYIINEGLALPYQILAVTFTNKAADEMKERIRSMTDGGEDVWVSTIHSFCTSVLRRYIGLLGYKTSFSIYSENDADRVVKRILREKHIEAESKDVLGVISYAKSLCISPEDFMTEMPDEDGTEEMKEVYEAYEESMKNSNALDFDDLLIKVAELFENHSEALEYYQNKLKYIHVDEFQDTNEIQIRIIKKLAAKRRNLFVVGDDDQSIYAWRGAKIENILNFDKDYPDAHVFKLEQNYRSTSQILAVANNVIKHNKARHSKTLFTERDGGAKVEYISCYNEREEADRVIATIRNLKYYNGYRDRDFAILVRNNAITRNFEQKLYASQIDYKVFGGFKFFDRKEVLDVFAYLRVLVNPDDDEAVERIVNFPRRGLGDTTIDKLVSFAKEHGLHLFELINNISSYDCVPTAAEKKLEAFSDLMSDLIIANRDMRLDDFVKYLVEKVDFESAYRTFDKDGKQKEDDYNRWLNIQELVSYVKEYVRSTGGTVLQDFLASCTLQSKGDVEDGNFVTLATIHAVKGLEFPVVFIVACEENILPSQKTVREKENEGLEEERRLMYVAATRAKDRLYITYTTQRFMFGGVKASLPSRFIEEARGEQQQIERKVATQSKPRNYTPYVTRTEPSMKTIAQSAPVKKTSSDLKKFVSGAAVTHHRYGEGTVIVVVDDTVSVLFKDAGIKKFVLSTAPLTVK